MSDVDAVWSGTMLPSEFQPGTGYVNQAHLMLNPAPHATSCIGYVNPQDTMLNSAPRQVSNVYNARPSTSGSNDPNSSRALYSPGSSFQIATDTTATGANSRVQPAATVSQTPAALQDYNGYGQADKENEGEFDSDRFYLDMLEADRYDH
jgi:hypothetical protein